MLEGFESFAGCIEALTKSVLVLWLLDTPLLFSFSFFTHLIQIAFHTDTNQKGSANYKKLPPHRPMPYRTAR